MLSVLNFNSKISFFSLFFIVIAIAVTPKNSLANNLNHNLKMEFDSTFNKMLDDPSNIELTMKYANIAIKMEDYESAIPALERILLFNPDLTRVKQELGVLYYKLDSFEMAESYLKEAASSKNAPKEVIEKANKYLMKIK